MRSPPHERFDAFSKFWDYLPKELEARELDSVIAFVEICNECNDFPFLCGYGNWGASRSIDPEETDRFRNEHEVALEEKLATNRKKYVDSFDRPLKFAKEHAGNLPIVCGEGVSYICHKKILWEEHSDAYWNLVKEGLQKYKDAGLWGTVIRTCCGTEDPSWELCKDRLLALNRFFPED